MCNLSTTQTQMGTAMMMDKHVLFVTKVMFLLDTNALITPAAPCFLQVLADRMSFPRLCQEMLHDHTQHCDVHRLQHYQQNALHRLTADKANIARCFRIKNVTKY